MKMYPTISRPLFKENVLIKDNTKSTKVHKSLKNVAKTRNNTGNVNNSDLHYVRSEDDFIELFMFMVFIDNVLDCLATISHKNKNRSSKIEKKIARNESRKRKQMFKTQDIYDYGFDEEEIEFENIRKEYEEAKNANLMAMVDRIEKDDFKKKNDANIENLKTFIWVSNNRGLANEWEQMKAEIEHENMLREFNKMKEMQKSAFAKLAHRVK